jgi:hypothetical protein
MCSAYVIYILPQQEYADILQASRLFSTVRP